MAPDQIACAAMLPNSSPRLERKRASPCPRFESLARGSGAKNTRRAYKSERSGDIPALLEQQASGSPLLRTNFERMTDPIGEFDSLFPDRSSRRPIGGQLVERLRAAIQSGGLAEGTRILPSRELASRIGVSRNT